MLTKKTVNNMAKIGIFDEGQRVLYNRRFSEDFKRSKVKELERNLVSISDICKTYSVSRAAVYKWIYKYSIMAKKNVRQVVETKSDTKKIQVLEERIKELERLVGQKQILLEFKDKMIEIAEETYGVDIKKKVGSKLSSGSTTTKKSTDTK
jgi:transposase-like protein